MDKGLLHYGSLAFLGAGLALSNVLEAFKSMDVFSILMVAGGLAISASALRPILNGDYKDFEPNSDWSYLIVLGALLMITGAALRITTIFS
ncbi:MAG: hypothetical protein ABEJ56_01055 [Candidatus Nanohaloarchaea archaeon]